MKSNEKIVLYITSILIGLSIAVFTFLDRDLMKEWFLRGGYYLILLLVVVWVFTVLRTLSYEKVRAFLYKSWDAVLVALIICTIIFVSVKPMFRVLSDETNLLAVSKSMTYEKRTDNVTMGKWYYDNFYPINRELPKRPLLFAFLTHILHTILGYRSSNAFAVNYLVLFTLLTLIYLAVRKELGKIFALVAVLFVASQGIVAQTATSGGFDILAALFRVICFLSLKKFIEKPSAFSFQMLWVNLLMLINVRYEGIGIFIIVMFALAALKYLKLEYFTNGSALVFCVTPIVLLLAFWQRLMTIYRFMTEGRGFSPTFFISNNLRFLKSLIDFNFFLPYATIVNLIGVAALGYFGYLFIARFKLMRKGQRDILIITVICMLMYWVMLTSFYDGKVDHPSSSRLYMIFFIMFSVLAAKFLGRFQFVRKKPVYALITAVLAFVIYHPVSVEDRFSRTQTLPRKYRFAVDFLEKQNKNVRDFLIITSRPGQYTVLNYGAVNFWYANEKAFQDVANGFNNHLYEKIFVIQDIEYETQEPSKDTRLDSRYKSKILAESQNKSQNFTRISEVVAIQPLSR